MNEKDTEFPDCTGPIRCLPGLFSAVFEKLYDKVANEQVLSPGDKLAVGATRVVFQAVVTSFPYSQRNRHSPSLLDHQPCCFKASFIPELRQDLGCVDAREFTYLFFTERFSNYHSSVHCYFLLFFGRFATSMSLNLSYCSCVST